ncbi:MAG: hypothetical protein ACP5HU_02970 [Phycisphaerae bacterium]
MKWNLAGIFAAVAVVLVTGPAAFTAPEPAEVPTSWQLDFEYERPRAVKVQLPGEEKPRLYWVMIYTVTNNTGEDRIFVPDFVLYTDTGQMIRAGTDVPSRVFQQVKRIYNEPLLKNLSDITGKLLQGADNARTGAAIWPDYDEEAGSFDIFVDGLSGESVEIELPSPVTVTETNPLTGKLEEVRKTEVVLSKTFRVRYHVPGTSAGRQDAPVRKVETDWVMR